MDVDVNSIQSMKCWPDKCLIFVVYVEGEPMEESIADPHIHQQTEEGAPHEVTYQLVEAGTKRARTKLADSDGYTYNVQLRRANATYWQCTVRPTGRHCKAIVIQRGDGFQTGKYDHNHPPSLGAATAARIMAAVKEKAVEDQFRPASAIVDEVSLFLSVKDDF